MTCVKTIIINIIINLCDR